MEEVCSAIGRLAVLKDPQAESLLLQACFVGVVGVCRLLHSLWYTPPSVVDQGVEMLDVASRAALRRITVGKRRGGVCLTKTSWRPYPCAWGGGGGERRG